ncbi:hypothetical protein E3N88_39458 [Mikania micrantha]|uniref:Reverse transcriptase zinc-binding domain-containing protein n=1 Tax=Mikania micrantha TaxID=192012 RepID=A0A5N6LX80_9ASTR|nr:hypothetical protein E3N88_39458 [Mikania micrantha]
MTPSPTSWCYIPVNVSIPGVWKSIGKIGKDLLKCNVDLTKLISGKVVKGNQVRFWIDKWLGNDSFDKLFPSLFNKEVSKSCTIKERDGKNSTLTALRTRNITPGSLLCKFCGESEQSVEHLFTACLITVHIWSDIERWCKLPPFFAFGFCDLMTFQYSLTSTKHKNDMVLLVIQTVVRCIWKGRNEAIFRNQNIIKEKILEEVKVLSYFWVKHRKKNGVLDWVTWMSFDVG